MLRSASGTSRFVALALALALAVLPASAFGAPTASDIQAKEAEREAALAEIVTLENQLERQMDEYVELAKRIDFTRIEVAAAAARAAEADEELVRAQEIYYERMVQIYRGGDVDYLEILFGAQSVPDLLDRVDFLVLVGRRDGQLIDDTRIARRQVAYEQQQLDERMLRLTGMQIEADAKRVEIEDSLDAQQARATELGEDIAKLMRERAAGEPQGEFSPDTVITDANFRDVSSMSLEDIQTFLEQQPGTLATYSAPDHAGVIKTTAQMIAEAAAQWGISPMVILVTLQKEQSLLTRSSPSQNTYDWAMGCGKADSKTYYEYQGFGNQIWWGAQKLDKNAGPWKPGIQMTIDGNIVYPSNASTYSLFKYTPHLRGTTSFWMLYWRYFGDPLA
ncbi:MAG: coiled-coil domain-containing protein [Coriobacteriia bacterium]